MNWQGGHFTTGFTRFTAIFVSVSLFLTQCLWAHATETHWRKGSGLVASRPDPFLLAQIPSRAPLGFQLPAAKINSRIPDSLKNISRNNLRLPASSALAPLVAALPQNYGSVRDISLPSGAAKGVVVHIQDVHLNPEAQANIGRAVQALMEERRVDLVALEGAFPRWTFPAIAATRARRWSARSPIFT